MDFTEIELDVADRVLTVTLNRPERLNAFTVTGCTKSSSAPSTSPTRILASEP